jgi:hypothetical protein
MMDIPDWERISPRWGPGKGETSAAAPERNGNSRSRSVPQEIPKTAPIDRARSIKVEIKMEIFLREA